MKMVEMLCVMKLVLFLGVGFLWLLSEQGQESPNAQLKFRWSDLQLWAQKWMAEREISLC